MTGPETTYQSARLAALEARVIAAAREWATAEQAWESLDLQDRANGTAAYSKALGTLAARKSLLRGMIHALDLARAEDPRSVL